MNDLFYRNSYQILGLDVTSPQKDIVKREKEIINLLRIDEIPSYEVDSNLFKDFRNEQNIKHAVEKLSNPEKRISEYYFWFEFRDSKDELALKQIKDRNYNAAIEIWENEIKKESINCFFYKKNLAILISILLEEKGHKIHLNKSLSLWEDIINNDKSWEVFIKNYKLYDDISTNDDIFQLFRTKITDYLADFYTDISKHFNDMIYFEEYYKKFNVKGSSADNFFLKPIYEKINENIEAINKIKSGESNYIQNEGYEEIKKRITKIKGEFNEIKKLGLYETSEIKVERDKVSEILRSVAVLLHNEYSLMSEADYIIKAAESICGTESLREKIKQDLEAIGDSLNFMKHQSEYSAILDQIKKGDFEKAIKMLNFELSKDNIPLKLRQEYTSTRNDLQKRLQTYGKPIDKAPTMYCLNGCGTRVYGDTLYFVLLFIPIIPWARYSVVQLPDGRFNFFGKLELHRWQKVWKYIGLGVIGIIIFSIMNSGSSSTTTTSSTHDTNSSGGTGTYHCTSSALTRANELKPDENEKAQLQIELDSLNSLSNELDSEKSNLDSMYVNRDSQSSLNNYNYQVDQYNSKLVDYKSRVEAYKIRAANFDQSVKNYNDYLSSNCTLR